MLLINIKMKLFDGVDKEFLEKWCIQYHREKTHIFVWLFFNYPEILKEYSKKYLGGIKFNFGKQYE